MRLPVSIVRRLPTLLLGLFLCCACPDGGFAGSVRAGEPASSVTQAAGLAPGAGSIAPTGTSSGPAAGSCTRLLERDELVLLVTRALEASLGRDAGELEVQLLRPWTALPVPDEPLTLILRDLPTTGLSPQCLLRFELRAGPRFLGVWQTAVQLRLWREVWVARTTISRGTLLQEADLVRERRDVLPLRAPLANLDDPGPLELEFCDVVPAGMPVPARALRPRPVLRRGQTAEAVLEDGALRISLRVEVLEEGAPGQLVRVRNPLSRRDLYGRVVDSQTVRVSL